MLGIGIAIGIYILPGIIASTRRIPGAGGVWILTILLGWTGLFWIIAMVIAVARKRRQDPDDIDPIVRRYIELRDQEDRDR